MDEKKSKQAASSGPIYSDELNRDDETGNIGGREQSPDYPAARISGPNTVKYVQYTDSRLESERYNRYRERYEVDSVGSASDLKARMQV